MSIPYDLRFAFDVQGYLHLPQALTPEEVAEYATWMQEVEQTHLPSLNTDNPGWEKEQMNHPVSRIIDADSRFGRFLDHPAVVLLLIEFLGHGYRHIDNDLLYSYPEYKGGVWHRGVRPHPTGHVVGGKFICPMVKVFYCMTDVGPDEGGFVVIPGSHKAQYTIEEEKRADIPAMMHIFDEVKTGDIILFNEALIHTGRPNPSQKTRKTIIVNFGRHDAGVWKCYTPSPQTLEAVTPRQREILTNLAPVWIEPVLS